MKKEHIKHSPKDILVVIFFWLLAAALVYMAYLKVKYFYH